MIFGTPPIVTNGLVLHLDAGNQQSYVTGSTVWNDLSGNNYSASMSGSVPFSGSTSPPYFTNAGAICDFKGSNSLASKISTEITIMCVANISDMTKQSVLFSKYQSSVIAGYEIEVGTASGLWTNSMRFFAAGSTYATVSCDYRGTTQLSANKPYLFTVVFSKVTNTVAMYANTTTVAATQVGGGGGIPNIPADWSQGTNPYNIGSYRTGANSGFLYGNLYNTLVYNRALSLQEITQNYNAFQTRFGLT